MCGLTAQHHALSDSHLHSARAELHTHGIWKHKAATLSPQANPKLPSEIWIWLWHHCQGNYQNPTLTRTKALTFVRSCLLGFALDSLQFIWDMSLYAVKCVLVIWFLNVRALGSRLSKHNKFPCTWAKVEGGWWHWGLFTGGQLVLIWQKIKAPRASLTFYPQYGSHLCRAQLILCPAHIVSLICSAGVNNSQSVVP